MFEKVRLGQSELYVNPIGFGANAIGGHNLYPNIDEDENRELLRTVMKSGINLIDTAYRYGDGRSEELIGEVLKEFNREDFVIATKASHNYDEEGNIFHDNSPEFLKKAVDEALERLQTDYIDLFYIHFPDEKTPKDEAVAALAELKKEGKIRAIGVSNFTLDQLKEANKNGEVDVVQDHYNLLERHNEKDLMEYTSQNQITFIPFYPLASGLLTGKYSEEVTFDHSDLRASMDIFKGEQFKENVRKVNQLKPIADKHGVEIPHVVLNWYFSRPSLDVIIPGAKHKDQVLSNIKTLDFKLSQEEIDQIDQIFS